MKTVVLYAALLGVAMVGSYITWTAEEGGQVKADAVSIYRAAKGDVQGLSYTSEAIDVVVERRSDARGEYAWIDVVERKKKKTPPVKKPLDGPEERTDAPAPTDGEDAVQEEAPVEIEEILHSFKGSDKALDLLKNFEPLLAKRELDGDLASTPSFGFDEPSGTVKVKRKKGEEELIIGGSTYGSKDRYVKHEGRLFLLEDTLIRPLQFASTRLRERRPHPWLEADVDGLSATRNGSVVVFQQHNRADRKAAFWSRAGEDTADDNATTWVEKVMRLKVSNKPRLPEGDLISLVSIELDQGAEKWTLTIAKDATEDERYLTSDFLRGTVPVSKGSVDELLADLDELLAN